MPRRVSSFDDLAESLGKYPWWVHAGAALVTFLVLQAVALTTVPAGGSFVETTVLSQMVSIANILKWAMPAPMLITAGLSAWSRNRGVTLHQAVAQDGGLTAVRAMSWQAFLPLLIKAFRAEGFEVVAPDTGAGETGADLILTAGAGTWCVQARQWRVVKTGVDQIQALHAAMQAHGASAGVLVSTGMFTDDAVRLAGGLNIDLLGGEDLVRRLWRVRAGAGA